MFMVASHKLIKQQNDFLNGLPGHRSDRGRAIEFDSFAILRWPPLLRRHSRKLLLFPGLETKNAIDLVSTASMTCLTWMEEPSSFGCDEF
jgi:hypothetical protein